MFCEPEMRSKVTRMATQISSGPKLPQIEGLRAFAVVAVMINHFAPQFLPGGYLGVDIFLVISGYVITKGLLANPGSQQIDFFKRFFARRVARLLPALVVSVGIAMVLVAMFVQPLSINYWTNAVTGISSSIGLSNMFLVIEQSNYFGSLADFNFFTHTWSLSVEMQFYLLFPCIFLVRSNIGDDIRLRRRFLIVSGLSIISFAVFVLAHTVNPTATYYLMPTRFWEFGVGSIACMCASFAVRRIKQLVRLMWIFVPGLLLAMTFVPVEYNVLATVITVLAAFWCVLVPAPRSSFSKLLTSRLALWIGERSYSIYLWHWVVLATARWTFGVTLVSAPVLVVVTFCCAVMSFNWVEQPSRQWARGVSARSVMIRGLGLAAAGAGFVFMIAFPLRGIIFLGTDDAEIRTTKSIYSSGCDIRKVTVDGPIDLNECASGVIGASGTIYLLGDSHAKQYEDPIRDIAKRRGERLVSTWGAGCIFPAIDASDASCMAGGKQVLTAVTAGVKRGDVVIIANQLLNYLSNDEQVNSGSKKVDNVVDLSSLDAYVRVLETFALGVQANGGRVIAYIDGLQFPGLNVGALCTQEWFRPNIPQQCIRSKSQYLETRMPIERALRTLESKGIVQVWDGMQWSDCVGDTCVASKMSDSNHFIDWYTWVVMGDSEKELWSPR
jgi:peptidoglycan/LPS O-acetylase OafA/YrhL